MSRLGLHQHSRGLGQTARVYRDKGTRKPGIRPYASSAGAGGARGGSLGAFDGSSRSHQLFSDGRASRERAGGSGCCPAQEASVELTRMLGSPPAGADPLLLTARGPERTGKGRDAGFRDSPGSEVTSSCSRDLGQWWPVLPPCDPRTQTLEAKETLLQLGAAGQAGVPRSPKHSERQHPGMLFPDCVKSSGKGRGCPRTVRVPGDARKCHRA